MNKRKEETDMPARHNRSFGRRHARKLSMHQQQLVDDYLPQLALPITDNMVDIATCAPAGTPLWLEIGFGAGEHLIAMTQRYPDIVHIGAEPFMNGVARCLQLAHDQQPDNLYIFPDDAQLLLPAIPNACLSRVNILFADPWRKKAHHKRRIINQETLKSLAKIMKNGALLRIATDHEDYAHWIAEQLLLSSWFDWQAVDLRSLQTPPNDWKETRYQQKARKQGREAVFFNAIRNNMIAG